MIFGGVWRVGFIESDLFAYRFGLSLLAGFSILILSPVAR